MAWNHLRDAGATWDDGEADVRRTYPHWAEHAAAYRANFELSMIGAGARHGRADHASCTRQACPSSG